MSLINISYNDLFRVQVNNKGQDKLNFFFHNSKLYALVNSKYLKNIPFSEGYFNEIEVFIPELYEAYFAVEFNFDVLVNGLIKMYNDSLVNWASIESIKDKYNYYVNSINSLNFTSSNFFLDFVREKYDNKIKLLEKENSRLKRNITFKEVKV